VTVDICPACGYPTIGAALCAFCRPLVAAASDQAVGLSFSFDRDFYTVESA
jgi:hypothetical protein